MQRFITAVAMTALLQAVSGSAIADEKPLKIGFITTTSGPSGGIGQELVDGFKLGLKSLQGKLGGRPVVVLYGDDQSKPEVGRQLADKMIDSDKVDIMTGINFSNVLLAVAKPVLDAGVLYVSVNAGPSQYAGRQCHPNFFVASFQNDTTSEAMGIYMQKKEFQNVYVMAPNYPAGRDMITGFKRYFKGKLAGEVYTTFNQLDYSAEIAQIRAAKPSAVYFFYPGGMGINFVKQYAQSGLKDEIPLFTGAGVIDQSVLPAIGDAAIGINTATLWSEESPLPASKAFAENFEKMFGRIPSPYAASAYDLAPMLDAALKATGGKADDKAALRKALETVSFTSVRGSFAFNSNHYPIQDFYLTQVVKDARGRVVNGLREPIVQGLKDSHAPLCQMPSLN